MAFLLLLVVLLEQLLFKLLVLLDLILGGNMVSIWLTVRHHYLVLSTIKELLLEVAVTNESRRKIWVIDANIGTRYPWQILCNELSINLINTMLLGCLVTIIVSIESTFRRQDLAVLRSQ